MRGVVWGSGSGVVFHYRLGPYIGVTNPLYTYMYLSGSQWPGLPPSSPLGFHIEGHPKAQILALAMSRGRTLEKLLIEIWSLLGLYLVTNYTTPIHFFD